jgi:hypothetical protein
MIKSNSYNKSTPCLDKKKKKKVHCLFTDVRRVRCIWGAVARGNPRSRAGFERAGIQKQIERPTQHCVLFFYLCVCLLFFPILFRHEH